MARGKGNLSIADDQGVVEPTVEAGPELEVEDGSDSNTTTLFEFSDEGPEDSGVKAGKYDALIATAFENEGRWARLSQTFTSGATGNTIAKRYANEVSETGARIEVKKVRKAALGKRAYFEVWVRAVAPEAAADEAEVNGG